jgi:hypothetical protein
MAERLSVDKADGKGAGISFQGVLKVQRVRRALPEDKEQRDILKNGAGK